MSNLVNSGLLLTVLLLTTQAAQAQPSAPSLNPLRAERPEQPAPSRSSAELAVPAATIEWTFHRTADGQHPDGEEQMMMWLMNRARQNPAAEGVWLATSTEPEVALGRDFFNVNLALLQAEFAGYSPKPPAAFDVRLYDAAFNHSLDQIARDAQDHNGQLDRIDAEGFRWSSYRGSVYSFAGQNGLSQIGLNAHAAFNIDWGPPSSDGSGMQDGRGHRLAIMALDGDYRNVGIAAVPENNPATDVGPYVVSVNYAKAQADGIDHFNRFIVGTVWQDFNANDRYDPGEGRGGVSVTPNLGQYFAVTAAGGGYAIPVTTEGNYQLTFAGGGLAAPVTQQVSVGQESVLLDYRVGQSVSSAQNFVEFLFMQFYGRPGDAGGLQYWAGQIESGVQTAAQVTEVFFNAAEFQDVVGPVAQLYLASLGRLPDTDGLNFWVQAFRNGSALAQIADDFIASPEFQMRFGAAVSNEDLVNLLYLNVLGRSADTDPSGLNYWINELTRPGGLTQAEVVVAFANSEEFANKTIGEIRVTLAYGGLLGRAPSTAELDRGVGLPPNQLITELLYSPDYLGPAVP